MKKSLELSPQGLQRIAALQDEYFTFEINCNEYRVNKSLAVYISPKISQMLKCDPTVDRLNIDLIDDSNLFDYVIALMSGEKVILNDKNSKFLYNISEIFENKELTESILKLTIDNNELNLDNAFYRLNQKLNFQINCDDEIEYISSHLYEIQVKDLKAIPPDTLLRIFNHDKLKVDNEAMLFCMVKYLIEINGDEYKILLSTIMVEHLEIEQINEFLELCDDFKMSMNVNEFTSNQNFNIWKNICQRMLLNNKVIKNNTDSINNRYVDQPTVILNDRSESVHLYTDEQHFRGIINELTRQVGGNVHQNKVIEITASSYHSSSPFQIADFNWNSTFWSANQPESWIKFDFLEMSVKLSGYTLKTTSGGGQGYYHMKSWIVEGSKDGIDWIEIDRQEENDDLNSSAAIKTYECQNQEEDYRFLRVKMIGPNHGNSNYLVLTNIEFFGSLFTFNSN
ncbi:hypothetical protein TRFO_17325 [Tritrichomonas foetus]|uniref:F5/8 type C domain-containing protein n=1 Tax=Tritrichomonas foetus TaxID=1144522 RepID=A0A1J4KSI9_9EUKA|nr:hypothetical protein TRFO_17325 [Tritrichomonas foetus]|eukprot:OHT12772.1 hypothetical protein TRFO_17325 [Tritrichomonas foetus]